MESSQLIPRRRSRAIRIGNLFIGGAYPIAIQSMNNTKTEDITATIQQLLQLEKAGCQIGRVTIPTREAALAIREIKKEVSMPIVGDIHFDHKMALLAIENGIDKIRINPGNIGGREKTREVIAACKEKDIPVRIGVNSGSLEKELIRKYNGITPDGMVESMQRYIAYFAEENFHNIVLSLKASNVPFMLSAYRKMAALCDYPLHLGVTEAGSYKTGTIKSSVGIGALLSQGIGDTLRVSLTGDVVQEIYVAKQILKSLHLSDSGVEIVSCPTCGRTEVDLAGIVDQVETALEKEEIEANLKVAIMGCAVNGPGEAREADLGLAGGKNEMLLFIKGEIIRKVAENEAVSVLLAEIRKMAALQK